MPYFQFCFVVQTHILFISVYWCCPKGYVVGVLLFYLTSSHSEKQLGFASINGVVVNIRPVNESLHYCAVCNRLLITRDNLGNWHIVASFHHTSGDAGCIDCWRCGTHEEQPNKVPRKDATGNVSVFHICFCLLNWNL